MAVWQLDDTRPDAGNLEAMSELERSLLAGLILILIESDVDGPFRSTRELLPLQLGQMQADRAGGVRETGLPQDRQVKEAFDEDQSGEAVHRFPGEETTLGTWQESMRDSGS